MKGVIVFLVLVAYANSFAIEASTGCQIDPTQQDANSPIVVLSGKSDFLYPEFGKTTLDFTKDQSVDFICPGEKVVIGSTTQSSPVSATCVSGSNFKINGKQVQWKQISCSNYPYRSARFTGDRCENNGKEIEIGFDVGNRFLRSILICFNEATQEALYSHSNITSVINERISNTPRPSWLQGTKIYDISSVNSCYINKNQKNTINTLLGLAENSTKYIQTTNYFLSRGHMTSMADNFYPAQQNASFFLVNVAPQWQTLNDNNWKQVEMDVRDYTESKQVDIQQWTGVYGVTTLPHEKTGKDTELYIYVKGNQKELPVPEIYWKVVYEAKSQKGVALISVNNPYISTYKALCTDVSGKLNWLKWKTSDQKKGFSYACTVDSFRKVVSYLPEFTVKGLLL